MKFGEWTKTSDELPPEPSEFGDEYLATVDNNQVVALNYVRSNVRGKDALRWEFRGRTSTWNVIAYMPFPNAFTE